MTLDARVYQRDGTLLSTISDILDQRWTEPENDAGEGAITVALDNANIADLDYGNLVRVRNDSTELYAFEIRNRDTERIQEQEHAGQVRTVSGPGVAILLGSGDVGGGVVYPESGVDGFRSDIRYFGWMSCSCFDHSTWNDTLNVNHDQDNPVAPWTANQPAKWPDPNANRIWSDAPTVATSGTDEVQEISLGTTITSGTFTLTFEGETTATIGTPWAAATVETELESLSTIDGVTVTGSGTDASPYIITFDGANVAARDVPLISVDHSSLVHTPNQSTVTETTQGVKGTYATAESCNYFYNSFTTASDMSLYLFINMKEVGEVYLDGVKVYEQTTTGAAKATQSIPLDLPSGDHCITARVCKTGTDGVGWFMLSLAEAVENEDGGFDLGSVVIRTGGGWNVLETTVSADPPGVTVGAIMDCLMTESQALTPDPDLDDITWTFDEDDDSDAVAFTEEIVHGFKVGLGLLDVLQQLMDMTGYTFRMNEDLSLDIWISRGTDRTATVEYNEPTAEEIVLSSYGGTAPKATTLLVETQDSLNEATDATGVATYGSRRIGATMGTSPSFDGLADFVIRTFAAAAEAQQVAPLATHGPSGLEPYTDFDISDWITAPDEEGVARDWRVIAIQSQMNEHADADWAVTLFREDAP